LVEAQRALQELSPGGAAAAGALADGGSGGDASSCGLLSSGVAGALPAGSSSSARLQEYALRAAPSGGTPTLAALGAVAPEGSATSSSSSSHDALAPYAATLPPDEGALVSRTGASTVVVTRAGALPRALCQTCVARRAATSAVCLTLSPRAPTLVLAAPAPAPRPLAVDPRAFEDDAAFEMMAAYTAEGAAHVNPVTSSPFRWGDTWVHARGGGIGTGRAEVRVPRSRAAGAEVAPAGGGAGALAPVSADRAALLSFHAACNGPRWGVARNWGVGEPCASAWHGVRCAGGRVVELALNLNNVACYGGLNVSTLAGASELRALDLSDNHMSGPLDGEALARALPRLQSLVLSGNALSGALPGALASLTALRHLDVSANALAGRLPDALGALTALEVLYAGEDGLERRNALSGPLPAAWASLTSLRRLSLAGNPVGGSLPRWLAALPALEEVTLRDARLTGELPPWLGRAPRLRVLDLAGNALSGELPDALGAAGAGLLLHLDVSRNALEGTLPGALGALGALRTLRCAHNHLDGTLPDALGGARALVELDVSHNELGGALPGSLARLPALALLRATHNRLSGPFPNWLLNESRSLRRLHVDGNRLSGSLAAAGWTRRLVELHARDNALSGALPDALGALTALASLQLSGNALRGTLPAALGGAAQLARLDVSRNALSGTIPGAAWAGLRELAELHASGNTLEGELPGVLGTLPLLRSLQLSGNALRGGVPAWLATAPSLRAADLSGNGLRGRLPGALWDARAGRVPPLAPRRSHLDEVPRQLNLGLNPLFCPLPPWAHAAVAATCVWVEVMSVTPAAGPAAGGTLLRVRTDWAAPLHGLSCMFSAARVQAVLVPAQPGDAAGEVTCVTPPLPLHQVAPARRTVRLAHEGDPICQFGLPFAYE
jgi:Leucine-rich repeat (LRR) protein